MDVARETSVRIAHVDGGADSKERVATFLERERSVFNVTTVTSARDGLAYMRSEDSGRSWSEVATFQADGVAGMVGLCVYRSGVLFHSEYVDDEYDQICVSTDGGDTWTAFGPNLPRIRTLTAAPAQ